MIDKTKKYKLDRESIGRVALDLADAEGLDAITARTLAERLGVTPMALYRHVPSIPAIVDGLLERVVRESKILDHDEANLDAWLITTFERIHAALLAHPAVVPLAGTPAGYGPESLAVVDATLGRLTASGISVDDSVAIFHSVFSFTLGSASLASAARRARAALEGEERRPLDFDSVLATLEDLPHVRRTARRLARFGDASTFETGLAALIAALRRP